MPLPCSPCSDGEVWRRQRRLVNPAFRRSAVDRYAQVRWVDGVDTTTTLLPSIVGKRVPCWGARSLLRASRANLASCQWAVIPRCAAKICGRCSSRPFSPLPHLPASPPAPPSPNRQAMLGATATLTTRRWRDGAARDVYADFNSLTLDITLEALFGGGAGSSSGDSSSGGGAGITGAQKGGAGRAGGQGLR